MLTITGKIQKYPARTSFHWYLGVLIVGTLVLRHPSCSADSSQPITWTDALFTATSALCVTGLTVRSTVSDFTLTGQLTILALIQLGGVGIMTITSFVLGRVAEHGGLRQQVLVQEIIGDASRTNLRAIVQRVLLLTLSFELIGALCMLPEFMRKLPFRTACFHSVFHSVSAFCNAGFALDDGSLTSYRDDWSINLTVIALIISGGIGYPVLMDLARCARRHQWRLWSELRLHTKLMLIGTFGLVLGGAISFFVLELDGVLKNVSWPERVLIPLFHSVSCRTAGFNTIDIADLSVASLFLSILLMVVGAGACSTGGGIKVSTAALLFLHAWSRFRSRRNIQLFRRTIPVTAVDRAMATVMLFLSVAAVALIGILVVEQAGKEYPVGTPVAEMQGDSEAAGTFLDYLFEIASALGTVGLSTGITPSLQIPGRLVIILLMFMGRLGPISIFAALSQEREESNLRFASEEPLVG